MRVAVTQVKDWRQRTGTLNLRPNKVNADGSPESVSRSVSVERFGHLLGVAPLRYLTTWSVTQRAAEQLNL
jgi:hypothetical protein